MEASLTHCCKDLDFRDCSNWFYCKHRSCCWHQLQYALSLPSKLMRWLVKWSQTTCIWKTRWGSVCTFLRIVVYGSEIIKCHGTHNAKYLGRSFTTLCLVLVHHTHNVQPQKPFSLFLLLYLPSTFSLYSASPLVLSFISSFPSSETYSISVYSVPFPAFPPLQLLTLDFVFCSWDWWMVLLQ